MSEPTKGSLPLNRTAARSGDDREVRSGEQAFRPLARIIKTLGRELISNEIIAIQELIKNSYDADATNVTITFEEPLVPTQGAIVIEDNGDGMTLDTLQRAWMEPATTYKRDQPVSRRNRRVTGEKGIGRFAAARVASVLEVTTISRAEGRRVHARFDWGAFDNDQKYLDEIRCTWRDEPAPQAGTSGTVLRLIGLNDEWERVDKDGQASAFQALRAELSRLVSPIAQPDDFKITLVLPPRFEVFSGDITPPAFLAKPRYWLAGRMDAHGVVDAAYQAPDGSLQEIREKGELPVVKVQGREPRCGPFSFEFRVWDRASDELRPLAAELDSTLRVLKRDLDAATGISVYRDGFRVLLPANDWLRLDLRRVQNPTMRLSNNQVVGVISITREQNVQLADQTNRQGLVDSPALEDFKIAVKEILSKLETRRDIVRRAAAAPEPKAGGVFGRLTIAPLRQAIESRYAGDTELRRILEETDRTLEQGVGQVKVVLARYRRLATLGQLIDSILHEGRTPLAAISNEVRLVRKDLGKLDAIDTSASLAQFLGRLGKRLDVVGTQTERLSALFHRIAPFSGRKRGRPEATTVEHVLTDTVALARARVEELGVVIDLPTTETRVTVDQSEMQSIFFNLVDNALYWLERVPADERRVRFEVERDATELRVIVSDSGPGIDDEVRDHIFEPYFTTRPDGVGLGLALAGELAGEYDGALELLRDGPLPGATFQVTLRRRIGSDSA